MAHKPLLPLEKLKPNLLRQYFTKNHHDKILPTSRETVKTLVSKQENVSVVIWKMILSQSSILTFSRFDIYISFSSLIFWITYVVCYQFTLNGVRTSTKWLFVGTELSQKFSIHSYFQTQWNYRSMFFFFKDFLFLFLPVDLELTVHIEVRERINVINLIFVCNLPFPLVSI